MSTESVVSFWQKVQRDEGLQTRVNPAAGNVPRLHSGVQASDLQRLCNIAEEAGFNCTTEDFAGVEAVIRFWGEVRRNKSLQNELKEADTLALDSATAVVVEIADRIGYKFTDEQLKAVTKAHVEAPSHAAADKLAGTGGTSVEVANGPYELSLRTALRGGWTAPYRFRLGPGQVAEYM